MKGVVYQAPFSIAAENVPDPELQHPNDGIVKITSSCICGSDLHMYEGRTAAQPGIIFGHENKGAVQEVGSAVKTLNVGLLWAGPPRPSSTISASSSPSDLRTSGRSRTITVPGRRAELRKCG